MPNINNGVGRQHVDLHQIDKRRATSKKHRAWASGDGARRIRRGRQALKGEGVHEPHLAQKHLAHGGDDIRIGGTAAQIAAHPLADLLVGQCRAVDRLSNVWCDVTGHARVHLLNGADGREDLPRRAVAALKAVAVQEGGLHRVKLVAFGEAFNRNDVLAFARRRQRQTGQDTLAVDDDGTRAARALIAPFLRACQTEHIAEGIQQGQARVHREFVGRVVHAKTRSHADCFPHSEDSRAHDTAPASLARGQGQ